MTGRRAMTGAVALAAVALAGCGSSPGTATHSSANGGALISCFVEISPDNQAIDQTTLTGGPSYQSPMVAVIAVPDNQCGTYMAKIYDALNTSAPPTLYNVSEIQSVSSAGPAQCDGTYDGAVISIRQPDNEIGASGTCQVLQLNAPLP